MRYLRIKNWEQFQHYKDRSPPWIKLHRELLTDYEFGHLPDKAKAHLLMIWLLASQMDGRVPDDPKWIAQRIGANEPLSLQTLISGGWLVTEQDASETLAERKQSAMPEKSRGETEAETEERRAKKARLETPTVEHEAIAAERGLSCQTEFQKYRDWQASTGKSHKDEVAGFRNWLRNAKVVVGSSDSRRERHARNMDILTGKVRDERTIDGVAERVDRPTFLAIPGGLREPCADDVEGSGPERSAAGMG